MKKIVITLLLLIGYIGVSTAQNIARYRENLYDGKYIHGVDDSGEPAQLGDPSYREFPSEISEGVYTWWNYSTSVGEPSNSYGVSIGFGKGQSGSAEIWAGWTNGKLFTRFLRDCCQGWSSWNEIWTAKTDGVGSGLDADTVDGLQPLLVQSSGNVGVGTTDPGTWRLAVNGNIRAKEVKVETSWSDFVFEANYDLPSLEEVEKHINEKGHLKDIPSAREVAENGILLGEMDAKLLQKIEELTLYVIELEKKINSQEKRINTYEYEVNELKSILFKQQELITNLIGEGEK